MSTDKTSGGGGTPDEAPDAFRDFIEERYATWEDEFGDEVHVRRTVSFDPKK
jgi:hypothetical protein